jgi:hypothetical protein
MPEGIGVVVFGLSFQVLPGFFIVAVNLPQPGSVESPGFGVFLVKDLFELPVAEGDIPLLTAFAFPLGRGTFFVFTHCFHGWPTIILAQTTPFRSVRKTVNRECGHCWLISLWIW